MTATLDAQLGVELFAAAPQFVISTELAEDNTTVIIFAEGDKRQAAGHLSMLTPHIGPVAPKLADDDPRRNFLKTKVSWPLAVQLAKHLGPQRWKPGPRLQAWIAGEAARRDYLPELIARVNPEAPAPRGYQVDGARLIAATGKAMLADDAGTGKTLTALLGLMELHERGVLPAGCPMLVVTPNSVMDAWVAAAKRWTPFRAVAWRGGPRQRERLLGMADLYVVSYGTLVRDAPAKAKESGPLTYMSPRALVVDETHLIKNEQAERSKSVRRLAHGADVVIGLGATPITHGIDGLWSMLNSMDAAAWPSKERYVKRYLDTVEGDYATQTLGIKAEVEPEFRRVMHGQWRRLAKEDVLKELPPKVYSTRAVDMPRAARAAYEGMREDMLAQLPDGGELPAMSVLAQLTRLLQLASASADVTTEEVYVPVEQEKAERLLAEGNDIVSDGGSGFLWHKTEVHVTLREPSWKVDELIEVMRERPGRQGFCFAPSAQLVRLAGERAAKEGYRVGYVIGGQSARERTAYVDAFQAGELDLICLTTAAGGVGLTLTAASYAVSLLRPWSFVESSQVEDRAHRIGSEKHESIEIIDIVAAGTIDEDVREIVKGKAGQLAELLDDQRIVSGALGGAPVQEQLDQAIGQMLKDPTKVRALLQKKG